MPTDPETRRAEFTGGLLDGFAFDIGKEIDKVMLVVDGSLVRYECDEVLTRDRTEVHRMVLTSDEEEYDNELRDHLA